MQKAFSIGIFIFDIDHSKGQGQGHAHSIANFLQMVTDRANIAIANKYKVAYSLSIGIITVLKVKVMYNSTVNISHTVTDRQTLPFPTNRKLHVGFRLLDLNLTLFYSKGQLGSWNSVF